MSLPRPRIDLLFHPSVQPSAVQYTNGAAFETSLYVVGGYNNYGAITSDVQIFDSIISTWSTGPGMPTAVWLHSTAASSSKVRVFASQNKKKK